ncbi:MAG: PIN domain-containing protein, partial [Archaeoglobaceae archaeon]|nr:PIN domain-containing protein [Archaeoglobaceae archaeon]MDW8118980.1 PIN domain-containing protein [Archaeoglobaceae archaeon]
MRIVPDTSIIIAGGISKMLEEEKVEEIIIPEAVIAELEAQANFGHISGFRGLAEVEKIVQIAKNRGIRVEFVGRRPNIDEIKLAKGGEIDSMIRDIAKEHSAILVTSDRVQSLVAKAKGIETIYVKPRIIKPEETKIMSFFTPDT